MLDFSFSPSANMPSRNFLWPAYGVDNAKMAFFRFDRSIGAPENAPSGYAV